MKKIKFLTDSDLDIYKASYNETEEQSFRRGTVLEVVDIEPVSRTHVNLHLDNSDLILDVPVKSFTAIS